MPTPAALKESLAIIWSIFDAGSVNTGEDEFLRGLQQKDWGNDPPQVTNVTENTTLNVTNIEQKAQQNVIFQGDRNFYETSQNFNFNITVEAPPQVRATSSRLPIKDSEDFVDTTGAAVRLGAPISLQQSIAQQRFGQLLWNPLEEQPAKIRQVVDPNFNERVEELNNFGLERYSKYLNDYPDEDDVPSIHDASLLISSESLRGLSGKQGLLFGSEILRLLAYYQSVRSLNHFIGVSDTIPNGYEVVFQAPTYNFGRADSDLLEQREDQSSAVPPEILQQIQERVERNYEVLGGTFWDVPPNLANIDSEATIRQLGLQQYPNDEDGNALTVATPITNLVQLIYANQSVLYHRAGFHRLPATLMESLIKPPEDQEDVLIPIYDVVSLQEWFIRQFDAIAGQFPIRFNYKVQDENGEAQTNLIEIPNVAEAIAQMLALNLTNAEEMDDLLNAVMRNLIESRSTANVAISTFDYVRANAEYLGYKGRERKREVDLAFTPGAKSLRAALENSTQTIIGWENQDGETLTEYIKKVLFSAEIIKAAFYIPFSPDQGVTGDSIRENLEKQAQGNNEKWEQFKNRVNNPTARYQSPRPDSKLRDLTAND